MRVSSRAYAPILGDRMAARAMAVKIRPRWHAEIQAQSRRTGVPAQVIEAVLRVERAARPWDVRVAEYAVFGTRLLLGRAEAAARMTLGPAQIRVGHGIPGERFTDQLIARARSLQMPDCAVACVAELLQGVELGATPALAADAVSLQYNGPASSAAYSRGIAVTIERVTLEESRRRV